MNNECKSICAVLAVAMVLGACTAKIESKPNENGKTEIALNVNEDKPKTCIDRPELTNDDIINETHKCEAAGLNAVALHCGDDYGTIKIQCEPKKQCEGEAK